MAMHLLCYTGSTEVDRCAVLDGGFLITDQPHKLHFPELITRKLGSALSEVTERSWAKPSQQGRGTLIGDNVTRPRDESKSLVGGVDLYAGLDDINCCQESLSDYPGGSGEFDLRVIPP